MAELETALVALLGAVYYALMRVLEDRGIPAASWLIGFGATGAPEYPDA